MHALTAMGRASAYFLVAAVRHQPGCIGAVNPGYISPLFHRQAGQVMVWSALVMIAIGAFILKKIVTIKG